MTQPERAKEKKNLHSLWKREINLASLPIHWVSAAHENRMFLWGPHANLTTGVTWRGLFACDQADWQLDKMSSIHQGLEMGGKWDCLVERPSALRDTRTYGIWRYRENEGEGEMWERKEREGFWSTNGCGWMNQYYPFLYTPSHLKKEVVFAVQRLKTQARANLKGMTGLMSRLLVALFKSEDSPLKSPAFSGF